MVFSLDTTGIQPWECVIKTTEINSKNGGAVLHEIPLIVVSLLSSPALCSVIVEEPEPVA